MSQLPAKQQATVNGVQNLLIANFKQIQSSLPRHMTPERMCRVALNTIRRTPALLECAPETLVAAIVEASSLGLEIDSRGQAYLVPFYNKKTGTKDVQLIPGYKGLADLAHRSGRVASVFAEVVCENDKFRFSLGLEPTLEHTPDLDNRGNMRAVYAVARMKDGEAQFVVMGKSDIEKVKKASKASSSGPWADWEEEMWKKTAIRRLCKMLPLSPEIQRAIAIDELGDAGLPQGLGAEVIDIPTSTPGAAGLNAALADDVTAERDPGRTVVCPNNGQEVSPAIGCAACKDRQDCPVLPIA